MVLSRMHSQGWCHRGALVPVSVVPLFLSWYNASWKREDTQDEPRNHSGDRPTAANGRTAPSSLPLLITKLYRPPVTPGPGTAHPSDGTPGPQPPATVDPDLGAGRIRQDDAGQHVAGILWLLQCLALAGRSGQRSGYLCALSAGCGAQRLSDPGAQDPIAAGRAYRGLGARAGALPAERSGPDRGALHPGLGRCPPDPGAGHL